MELDLSELSVNESVFVPYLRITYLLGIAANQVANLGINVSYRVTVVDGKYGVLFTRRPNGRCGLRDEDARAS